MLEREPGSCTYQVKLPYCGIYGGFYFKLMSFNKFTKFTPHAHFTW